MTKRNLVPIFAALGTILGLSTAVQARTLRVNNRADTTGTTFCSGSAASPCTIRRVFELADQNPGEFFTVHVDVIGRHFLNSSLTLRKGTVHLIGNTNDASSMVIDGQNTHRIIAIRPDEGALPYLKVEKMSLSNGSSFDQGAGVYVGSKGSFDAQEAIISDNVSNLWGSGIFAGQDATVGLYRTRVERNINRQIGACGGGVTSTGGGVAASSGSRVDIISSMIRGNKACRGAGIWSAGTARLTMVNSTITENEADLRGGGIMLQGSSSNSTTVTLKFNTIVNNIVRFSGGSSELAYGAGLAVTDFNATLFLSGNIIAENRIPGPDSRVVNAVKTAGFDCLFDSSNPTVNSYSNLLGTSGSSSVRVTGPVTFGGTTRTLSDCQPLRSRSFAGIDSRRLSPKLSAPQSAGGSGAVGLHVMVPASDSLVNNNFRNVSTAPDHSCIFTDARSFLRPMFPMGVCDVGAVEFDGQPQ